jgi:uncharacterized protein (TIGR03437 family)
LKIGNSRSARTLFVLLSALGCSRLYADVTLKGIAGGDVVYASVPVTLPARDFFAVSLDGGSAGTVAPSSLSVSPTDGYTDATVVIAADPLKLQAGTVTARLVISFPNGQPTVIQNVTFQVSSAPPKLQVLPDTIVLNGVNNDFIPVSSPVFIRNAGGGGPQPFTATLVGNTTPFLTVTPTSGTTNQNAPALTIQDHGTPKAKTGAYTTVLHITSGSMSQDVPVNFLAKSDLLFFGLSQTGAYFKAQQAVGTQLTQSFSILVASGAVSWTASVSSAQDFVTVTPTSATVSPGAPGKVTIGVKPLNTPGTYYALVTITPTVFTDAISPVFLTVVYNVTAAPPVPDLGPAGLVFVSALGAAAPASQNINIFPSSTTAQAYKVGAAGGFIDVVNPSGSDSGSSPAPIAIKVDPTILPKPGFYRGNVQVGFPQLGTYRTADVLTIILPSGVTPPANSSEAEGTTPQATCTPSQIAVVGTTMAGNFSTPASWPTVIQTRVLDDCANSVTNAKVVLDFSNGDAPLSAPLEACSAEQGCGGNTDGRYAATWVSSHPGPVTVTVRAVAGTMSTSAIYTGAITPNIAPAVAPNGTVNNLFVQPGAALAPGTIAAIYGSSMSGGLTGQPGQVPLITKFQGTSVVIGGRLAPFYYASDGQLDVQLPSELNPNQTYALVVTSNGAISVPQNVTVGSATPGVAAFPDGRLIAQHLDFTFVDAGHPAKAGEILVMYLDGMGATNPPVPTGTAAPSKPLAEVVTPAIVTVDGNPSVVVFAGLSPGAVGLYQIDFTVPTNAKTGNLNVVVTQNGTPANTTTIPVVAQ